MAETKKQVALIGIVDDDDALRAALKSFLRASNFAIDTFSTAEAFLASRDRGRIQCLILDVRLPGMSGIELQRHLLRIGDRLPIVFISAHGDEDLRRTVMDAGAAAFLSKPVRSHVLLDQIKAAMSGSSQSV